MKNKSAITLVVILFALASIYQLSFTWKAKLVEDDAKEFAKGSISKEAFYLDSVANDTIFNFLFGLRPFTYRECKERELNYGLDLKGGMNVVLEIPEDEIIRALAGTNENDPLFLKTLNRAKELQKNSQDNFVTIFGKAFNEIKPGGKIFTFFYQNADLKDKIKYNDANDKVLQILSKEADEAFKKVERILRDRIDKFGVMQPNIQILTGTRRILLELPGVRDPERAKKLIQSTAKLEFWETYENKEIYQKLVDANKKIKEIKQGELFKQKDTSLVANDTTKTKKDSTLSKNSDTTKKSGLLDKAKDNKTKDGKASFEDENPLFTVLMPNTYQQDQNQMLADGPVVGLSQSKDTAKINKLFSIKEVKNIFPNDLHFAWSVKGKKNYQTNETTDIYELVALKSTRGKAALDGDVVVDAMAQYGQTKAVAEVSMTMNSKGANIWAKLTKEASSQNPKRSVAIVLDGKVYSNPTVQSEIAGGSSQITGNFSWEEASDLANVLKTGKLLVTPRIVEESVVGPSLGKESIDAGLLSFILAFIGVLLYMQLYYSRAGLVANIALFANVFFLFGVLASIKAVLTLPGIAGIVLTLAMAVDSNVIIYERMREELRAGKGIKLIIKDGFKHALSAIIDGHLTTILTGVVLFMFGSGPVQGFATTLIIGLLLSLFTSIFVTRIVFEWMVNRNIKITLGYKWSMNLLTKVNFNFIKVRKKYYIISGSFIFLGLISLAIRGLDPAVDFTGGRTYIVRFDKDVVTTDIREKLKNELGGDAPEVKTFGPSNQVKITTKYKIDETSTKMDSVIERKLYNGISGFFAKKISYEDFSQHKGKESLGKLSSQRVGPTIADDLIQSAFLAVFFGLIIIFIYITFRFRNWQFGLGGIISLFHDTMVIISVYSIFYGILPFSLEVDQAFIASLLTIIGYSIMDTVIIFDRIREYRHLHPKWELKDNINAAINSTLGRTINTSGVTLVVLLVMFIFGGEILRGFVFALLIGVAVGTYSSVFNATPVAYDLIMMKLKRKKQ